VNPVPLKIGYIQALTLGQHPQAAGQLFVPQADNSDLFKVLAVSQSQEKSFRYDIVIVGFWVHHQRGHS
jgi:hypothetical protein